MTLTDTQKIQRANLEPFVKGDQRINRNGRPSKSDMLKDYR